MQATYPISEIKQIIDATGEIVEDSQISLLVTDSRRINHPGATLFFALSGRRDGHEFISEAYTYGVRNFVVTRKPDIIATDVNFLFS